MQNSKGLLGRVNEWMTPERGIALQGLGTVLAQMDAGQPVNASPAYNALLQRQQRAERARMLEESGIMERFSPEQRAILAQMEPGAAQQIIAQTLFREPEPGPQPTDDMREYEFARSQGYQGTFQDFMMEMRRAGATNITNNMGPQGVDYGDAPTDMAWLRNSDGSVRLDENGLPMAGRIKGSKSDREALQSVTEMAGTAIGDAEREQWQEGMRQASTDVVVSAAARAREAAQNRAVDGVLGRAAAINPESQNAEIYRQVAVLEANASAENLNAMRAASPTGGALGNVTERELALLKDKSGALDPASPNFERDLADYERTLLRTIHGPDAGDKIFEATRINADDGLSEDEKRYLGIP